MTVTTAIALVSAACSAPAVCCFMLTAAWKLTKRNGVNIAENDVCMTCRAYVLQGNSKAQIMPPESQCKARSAMHFSYFSLRSGLLVTHVQDACSQASLETEDKFDISTT